jgi:hypothetical protein
MGTALKRWLSRGLSIFGGLLAASAAGAGEPTTVTLSAVSRAPLAKLTGLQAGDDRDM